MPEWWEKTKIFFANPGYSAKVVGGAVKNLMTGQELNPHSVTIPPDVAKNQKVTIASVVGTVPASVFGSFSGIVAPVAASVLPDGKAKAYVEDHPIATTLGLTAVAVAPGAVFGAAGGLARGAGSIGAASIAAADDDDGSNGKRKRRVAPKAPRKVKTRKPPVGKSKRKTGRKAPRKKSKR